MRPPTPASFTEYREAPWPVPGNISAELWFRGIRNLDASLDLLFRSYGLGDATGLIRSKGSEAGKGRPLHRSLDSRCRAGRRSAGGLSTLLHVDHVVERVRAVAPSALVVGNPVWCATLNWAGGFFLD